MALCFINGPVPPDDAPEAKYRNAQAFNGVAEVDDVILMGTPDPDGEHNYNRRCAEIRDAYAQAKKDPEHAFDGELKEVKGLNPDTSGSEGDLAELVGAKQANALADAGYGTLEAARALSEEDLTAIKGVGKATYERLQEE